MMDQGSTPQPKRRTTAFIRTERRRRIFDRLSQGWAYDDIAREEKLTLRRVRQIVAEDLNSRGADDDSRHTLAQLARLGPALKAAGEAVAQGDVRAIAPLIKVLDRLDRYQKSAEAARPRARSSRSDPVVISELMRRLRRGFEEELRQDQAARQAAEAQSRGDASPSGGETPAPDLPDAPATMPSEVAHQTTDRTEFLAGDGPGEGSGFGSRGGRPTVRITLNGMAAG
jgi:hypothetical protein